jgi:hypothetical protein
VSGSYREVWRPRGSQRSPEERRKAHNDHSDDDPREIRGAHCIRGAFVGWYSYPFVDVTELAYRAALLNCVGIAALFLACGGLALVADRRLSPAPGTG